MHKWLQRHWSSCAALFAIVALICGTAAGQTYPTGPVRIIVPIAAGGVGDTMGRLLSQSLGDMWGQPVIVENRPGAAEAIGVQALMRSAPDGHTLLVTANTTVTVNPLVYKSLPYDPVRDLTPIIGLGEITPVLGISSTLPFTNLKELINYAKSNPGKLSYGSAGPGTYMHLSTEEIKQRLGLDILHVPYKGAAPAINALVAGEISMMLLNVASFEPHEKTGKLRILAAAGRKKPVSRPDLPMVADYGLPGFATGGWFGLFGPAKMSPALVARIHADVDRALNTPKTRQFFAANSFVRMEGTSAQLAELIQQELKQWAPLVKATGVTRD